MNQMLLLNILLSGIKNFYPTGSTMPVDALLTEVRTIDPAVGQNEVIEAVNNIIASGFVTEINRFDEANGVLYFNS